jgi:hypothetical protein
LLFPGMTPTENANALELGAMARNRVTQPLLISRCSLLPHGFLDRRPS